MAIERSDVLKAVEKYLPRTVNFAQSSDLGEKDREAIFARLLQIMLVAMLLDADAPFYLTYLSSQRFLEKLTLALSNLQTLQNTDHLKGIREVGASRIASYDKLDEASFQLAQLGGSIVDGQFGSLHFGNFKESIEGWLVDEVRGNVTLGNRDKIDADIRSVMESLDLTWEDVVERRSKVFNILPEFLGEDIKARVASTIISAIEQRIAEIKAEMQAATTSEQGIAAEGVLIDLAAAEASLAIVGDAPVVEGELVVISDDGRVESPYLAFLGLGDTDPFAYILKSAFGELFIDPIYLSITGEAVDDVDGDDITPFFDDPTVLDWEAVPEIKVPFDAGETLTLTFADTGEMFTIREIAPDKLTVSPEMGKDVVGYRYLITTDLPGSIFLDQTQSFLSDIYGPQGVVPDVEFVSGTGAFVQDIKATGFGGTNLKVYGFGTGIGKPFVDTGVDGEAFNTNPDTFDASLDGSTFLSSGVDVVLHHIVFDAPAPFAGTHSIDAVLSQTLLEVDPLLGAPSSGVDWTVERTDANRRLQDAVANFLTSGVVIGDEVTTLNGGNPPGTDALVEEVTSQTEIKLDDDLWGITGHETGLDWYIKYADAQQFTDINGTFLSSNVQPGDTLDIALVGTFEVLEVLSQQALRVTAPITAVPTLPSFWDYSIYTSATETLIFERDDAGDFAADGVAAVIDGEIALLRFDGVDYQIAYVNPVDTTQLYIQQVKDGAGDVVTDPSIDPPYPDPAPAPSPSGPWSILAGQTINIFQDTVDAPFAALLEGDELILFPGAVTEQRVRISVVNSPSEVVLAEFLTADQTGIPYATTGPIKGGMEMVDRRRRNTIEEVYDDTKLRMVTPLSNDMGRDVPYYIVQQGSPISTNRFVDPDLSAAFAFDAPDFESLIGARLDMNLQTPVQVVILDLIDGDLPNDTIVVDRQIDLGLTDVAYRIVSSPEDTSDEFLAPSATPLGVLEGDVLSIWGLNTPYSVLSEAYDGGGLLSTLTVEPRLPSKREDQEFAVVRGGSKEHGRYILYDTKNAPLLLDADTELLRLQVAEVLIDYGVDLTDFLIDVSGELPDDGDGDSDTNVFLDLTLAGLTFLDIDGLGNPALYGDVLDVNIGGDVIRTFVNTVVSATEITIDPPLPITAGPLAWQLRRNSVSFALREAKRLELQLQDIFDLVRVYFVPRNAAIQNVLDVLSDLGYDRAVNLIYDGEIAEFITMLPEGSRYSSFAKAGVQVVGQNTQTSSEEKSRALQAKVIGKDPATGQAYTSNPATSFSGLPQGRDVDVVVGLAEGVAMLEADDYIATVATTTLEEYRNLAIYRILGEVESDLLLDTHATLPWVDKAGSKRAKIEELGEKLLSSIQYMIDHPEEFSDE